MSLVEILERHAQAQPERVAYRFLSEQAEEQSHLTYRELYEQAQTLAKALRKKAEPGDRALLLYPHGPGFIVAFWACLASGVVAVPVLPPDSQRQAQALRRLAAIIADAQPRFILTTREGTELARRLLPPEVQRVTLLVATDDESLLAALPDVPDVPDVPRAAPPFVPSDVRGPDAIAFLQYTSGSTGAPKGVMVSHANLLANQRMIERAFAHDARTIFVSWLPLYHDMGLVGCMLQPCYLGGECNLLAPATFLRNPFTWLLAISRYRAMTSGAPNFAYDLAVRRTSSEERRGLDLSSWKLAFNGSEQVRPETVTRFAAAFAPYGFAAGALYPCYGLAEASLLVTGGQAGKGARVIEVPRRVIAAGATAAIAAAEERAATASGREGGAPVGASAELTGSRRDNTNVALVSCGHPWLDGAVAIVDPQRHVRCRDEQVGEIWVRGSHVARGYFNNPAASAEIFGALLCEEQGAGVPAATSGADSGGSEAGGGAGAAGGAPAWLRTGDLGFIKDGELFFAGRIKDLIIVRGVNHYPQDIEYTVGNTLRDVSKGQTAVFAVEEGGEEKIVVVQAVSEGVPVWVPQHPAMTSFGHQNPPTKTKDTLDGHHACEAIRQAVLSQHDIDVHVVVLVRPHGVPKTSSGKVQRFLARDLFLAGKLPAICQWTNPHRLAAGALTAPAAPELPPRDGGQAPTSAELERFLVAWVAGACHIAVSAIGVQEPFSAYGMDSARVLEMLGALEKWLDRTLSDRVLIKNHCIASLAAHLAEVFPQLAPRAAPRTPKKMSRADVKQLLAGIDTMTDEEFQATLDSKR